jgi:gluconolactonase
MGPNGVGLSPDGSTVYVAESFTGHLVAWDLDGPGQLRKGGMGHGGRVVAATKGHFDSLAVEEDGNIVVAALPEGLCVITPDGDFDYVAFPDLMTTNVCFGGPDRRTAFVTLSASGKLVAADWPRAGLKLPFGTT